MATDSDVPEHICRLCDEPMNENLIEHLLDEYISFFSFSFETLDTQFFPLSL